MNKLCESCGTELITSTKSCLECGETQTLAMTAGETVPSAEYHASINLERVVVFPDKSLEYAVRKALEKPVGQIIRRDFMGLSDLFCVGKEIRDLSGLEQAHDLTLLNSSDNHLSDISPLAPLTNLTGLFLGYNEIRDINPLASLTNLRRLHLGDNLISDLNPLESLTSLNWLYLRANDIIDIGPLRALTNLTYLGLSSNPLNKKSFDVHVPSLRAKGVVVQITM